MNNKKILADARDLYSKGKWKKTIDLIDTHFTTNDEQQIAEANRIKAWAGYYLAIKGEENKKLENLEKAEEHFKLSLIKMEEEKGIVSILNGLPLVLWIQGKKEEAWKFSNKAIERFPKTPSIWNTHSILCRWAQDFEKAVEVCEKVYETAKEVSDWRTAGHGKHNQGDALLKLGNEKGTLDSYREAEKMYMKDGKSDFHLKAVRKKIQKVKSN